MTKARPVTATSIRGVPTHNSICCRGLSSCSSSLFASRTIRATMLRKPVHPPGTASNIATPNVIAATRRSPLPFSTRGDKKLPPTAVPAFPVRTTPSTPIARAIMPATPTAVCATAGKRGFLLVGRLRYISRIWGWKLKATIHTGTPSIASAAAPPRPSPRKSTGLDPTSEADESTTDRARPSFALPGHARATSRSTEANTPAYEAMVAADEYDVSSAEGSCSPAPKLNTAGHDIHHGSWSGKAVFAKGVIRSANTIS
mmetsp:Transcript_2940/g.5605  ORF Transcript_2940/g.5605 Transcript_2940/m.5605 type:complete len:258 (-) Transcript_2940:597-1370(-)